MADGADLLIGIDLGTSVVKAVAFDLGGRQVAAAAVLNRFVAGKDGSACQSLEQTWTDCVERAARPGREGRELRAPHGRDRRDRAGGWHLAGRLRQRAGRGRLALARRARGSDGRAPQRRAAGSRAVRGDRHRPQHLPAGCAVGADRSEALPRILDRAEVALHCKDWLYLNLTGVRATDPSEASWTFGNFRTRRYDDTVIEALGLTRRRGLLPGIIDGTEITHPLTDAAAAPPALPRERRSAWATSIW